MKPVAPEELKSLIDKGCTVIDVREKWEYDLCKIPNAVLSPLGLLQTNPPEISGLDKSKPTVMYCHHGRRSAMACQILAAMGFSDLYNLTGGIDAYSEKVDSSVERY